MNYKYFKLEDIFDVSAPLNSDKKNFVICEQRDNNAIPFLGRSSKNNGIVSWVKKQPEMLNEGNTITVALDGSSGSTFYQEFDFHSGQNTWILKPKNFTLDKKIGLFLVTTLRKAFTDYTYAMGLTKKRIKNVKILLPQKNGLVDVSYIKEYMNLFTIQNNSNIIKQYSIPSKYKYFKIKDIFSYVKNAKTHKQYLLKQYPKNTKKNLVPFVSAKKENNGVAFFTPKQKDFTIEKNCITISNNGSVGYTTWRPYEFISNSDVTILKTKKFKLEENIALFISTSMQKAAKAFSYGNKLKGDKLKNLEILLPVTEEGKLDLIAMKDFRN